MARSKKNGLSFNLIYMLTLVVVTLVLSFATYTRYQEKLDLDAQIQDVSLKIEEQKKANEELREKMSYKDSDENIEKLAREQLNMVKPNEIVFVDQNK